MAAVEEPKEEEPKEPKERNPRSPLEHLVLNRDAASIKLRLASGKLNTDHAAPDSDGPLHCAAVACQTKTSASAKVALQILDDLLEAGFKVDAQNALGRTPLHLAVLHCSAEAVKRILNKRADTNMPDNFGQTAIDYAHTLDEWGRDNGGRGVIRKLLGIKEPKPKPKKERTHEEPQVHHSHCATHLDPAPSNTSSSSGSGSARPSALKIAAQQLMNTTERDAQWISSAHASGRGVARVVPHKLSTLKKGPPQPTARDEPKVNWCTEWAGKEMPPEPKYSALASSIRGRPSASAELTSLPLRPWHTKSRGSSLSARAA
eukprot:gnl/MRDRNA2_/MRDRNA2_100891_c0_seq1.p1 gnl/MRDRNA2_/MRDRNA2_100891_c0~~gnl/MRDRNA2_/MRDRNA2_100891_c0_seq1.p1  ORF type:complete len:337 (+),score=55.52 gnl/MRDRNA2_/MRDRNA2_100891_c0_seq1:60-1013(+)